MLRKLSAAVSEGYNSTIASKNQIGTLGLWKKLIYTLFHVLLVGGDVAVIDVYRPDRLDNIAP
ncbi:hypothetical protein [Atribacter laminatus]|uniref:hypothetical protein n=1 Tax=Atribacter laminatus TaxID=2847778 RepID=UPI001C4088FF|nr:hypothetical protein [Atribacter laminatus]